MLESQFLQAMLKFNMLDFVLLFHIGVLLILAGHLPIQLSNGHFFLLHFFFALFNRQLQGVYLLLLFSVQELRLLFRHLFRFQV
jgi:hypothetical protein